MAEKHKKNSKKHRTCQKIFIQKYYRKMMEKGSKYNKIQKKYRQEKTWPNKIQGSSTGLPPNHVSCKNLIKNKKMCVYLKTLFWGCCL